VAEAFGYSAEELTSIPAGANMGLSCGNPTATAHLRPGEVVVDLGSGGGLDVFLAAKMVGLTGRAIGIDMTPAMIDRARANAASGGYTNVEFYQSTIDSIPLPDASVDCVISNCVLNLAPDNRAGLLSAGFEHVEIVDSGSDLNAYAKVENQSGCCSPAMDEGSCCSSAPDTATLHEELSDLLSKYDVNAAAASVKVYAIKPKAEAVIKTALPCCAPGC
jgi:arsenite methyltransferase